jgi:hypothetical protein
VATRASGIAFAQGYPTTPVKVVIVVASTPEEFGDFMKAEVERWTQVVRRGRIQPE